MHSLKFYLLISGDCNLLLDILCFLTNSVVLNLLCVWNRTVCLFCFLSDEESDSHNPNKHTNTLRVFRLQTDPPPPPDMPCHTEMPCHTDMPCHTEMSHNFHYPTSFSLPYFGRIVCLCRVHTDAWMGNAQLTPTKHGQCGSCGRTRKSPGHADVSSPKPDRLQSQL